MLAPPKQSTRWPLSERPRVSLARASEDSLSRPQLRGQETEAHGREKAGPGTRSPSSHPLPNKGQVLRYQAGSAHFTEPQPTLPALLEGQLSVSPPPARMLRAADSFCTPTDHQGCQQ